MDDKIPHYISILFILLKLSVFFIFIRGFKASLNKTDYEETKKRKIFLSVAAGIFLWLITLAILAHNGFFLDFDSQPPKLFIAVAPIILVIIISIFSGSLDKILLKVKPWWLINFQVFRIPVEIILWLLFLNNIIPVQMTFEGFNFDILVGLTAVPIAYFCFKKRKFYYKSIIVWNILGLLLLLNIVTIAILSTPSPLRFFMNELANTAVAYYPFIWFPGFLVPMALFLHLASLRQIKLKRGTIIDF